MYFLRCRVKTTADFVPQGLVCKAELPCIPLLELEKVRGFHARPGQGIRRRNDAIWKWFRATGREERSGRETARVLCDMMKPKHDWAREPWMDGALHADQNPTISDTNHLCRRPY